MKARICPSILSADFAALGRECRKSAEHGADWIHVDVMDGHFVPNLTIGPPVVASLRRASNIFLDVHLMVEHPETYVQPMRFAGAGSLTFHFEATDDIPALIDAIHDAGMRACIAIKPATPVDCVLPYLDMVEMILVMTVEPGFGGQPFMADMMSKVRRIREMRPMLDIEVDGGLNLQTIDIAAEAGANCIVTGAVFRTAEPVGMVQKLRKSVNDAIARKCGNLP